MNHLRFLIIDSPAVVLSWLGKQGTRALAAIVVIGIALPPVGAVLKPYVTEAIFVILCIAFLRVDVAALKTYVRRPTIVLAATAWTSVAVPVLFFLSCYAVGLDAKAPDLFLSLMLQATVSPMMAAPALVALMGLDATLVLATLLTSTALMPLTAPLFTHAFVGPTLAISPLGLGVKLFAIIAGAALVGFALRRMCGIEVIEQHKAKIDGINILVLFVFVAAIMESVGVRFLAAPLVTISLTGLGFAVFFAIFFLTMHVLAAAGRERALALAFMVAQRNMGLMLAAAGGALPELTWLYFAVSQFPIYLSPQLLQPLARRVLARQAEVYASAEASEESSQ